MDGNFPLSDRSVIEGKLQPPTSDMLLDALNEHEITLARVSRVLHDEVSQVLSAAGLQLDSFKMDFRNSSPEVEQRVVELQAMLERAIERLRALSNELNPSVAERAGLRFALEQMVGKARGSFSGALRLQFDSGARVPPPEAKTFYKIAECALEAAMARPECTSINIQFKQSHGQLVLEVNDNGAADPDSSVKPLEILWIEFHASKSNFELTRNESAGKGNSLRVTCPATPPASS